MKARPSYLSIDIDFFNWTPKSGTGLVEALQLVKESGKLDMTCDNHKLLLPSINASGCRRVNNVDTHSDIYDTARMRSNGPLNCGNWANHIHAELKGVYSWFYPRHEGRRCDSTKSLDEPFPHPRKIGWHLVKMIPVETFPVDLITSASVIGISVSYFYLTGNMTKDIVRQAFRKVFGHAPAEQDFAGI